MTRSLTGALALGWAVAAATGSRGQDHARSGASEPAVAAAAAAADRLVGAWSPDVDGMRADERFAPLFEAGPARLALMYMKPMVLRLRDQGDAELGPGSGAYELDVRDDGTWMIMTFAGERRVAKATLLAADWLMLDPFIETGDGSYPVLFRRREEPRVQLIARWTIDMDAATAVPWIAALPDDDRARVLDRARSFSLVVRVDGSATLEVEDDAIIGRVVDAPRTERGARAHQFEPPDASTSAVTIVMPFGDPSRPPRFVWEGHAWPAACLALDYRAVLPGAWELDEPRLRGMIWIQALPEDDRERRIAAGRAFGGELSSMDDQLGVAFERLEGGRYAVRESGELSHFLTIEDRDHVVVEAGYGREYPLRRVR